MFLRTCHDNRSNPLDETISRVRIAIAFLALVLASLGSANAFAASVDQSSWTSLKKEILLPNGVRLSYVELGNRNGEPLLLLHGYTDSSRSWSLTAPYLSDLKGKAISEIHPCANRPALPFHTGFQSLFDR